MAKFPLFTDIIKESLGEREMTPGEKTERERLVKGMKKGDWSRYGSRAKDVMYATATKRAMGETSSSLKEDVSWSGFIDFIIYYEGYAVVKFLLGVVIVLGVWLAQSAFMLPAKFQKWAKESRRAYDLFQVQKKLSPADIARVTAAAKEAYANFGPRVKSQITMAAKRLERAELDTPEGRKQAAQDLTMLGAIAKVPPTTENTIEEKMSPEEKKRLEAAVDALPKDTIKKLQAKHGEQWRAAAYGILGSKMAGTSESVWAPAESAWQEGDMASARVAPKKKV